MSEKIKDFKDLNTWQEAHKIEQADFAHKILQGLITKSKRFLNHKS